MRTISPFTWKKFILYREVPASGTISVTMALTGLGKVYFDDVRIEPLIAGSASPAVAAAPPRGQRRRADTIQSSRHVRGSAFIER